MANKNKPIMQLLWGAREARAEARRRHLRVQELEARCTAITAKMNGMPGGGGDRHSLEQAYIALSEERELELEAIRQENARYHWVENLIAQLSAPEHRAVLRLRYLRGLNWAPIQREMERDGMYYSDRHIYRLHGDALRELRRVLREQEGDAVAPYPLSRPEGDLNEEVRPDAVPAETAPELLH